jgi:AcrR family transcriptional regulator
MRRTNMERVPAPVESAVHDRQTGHDEEDAQRIAKAVTMRRVPRQARGERRIAAILEAAAQVFYEVGFDAATTGMIAERAQTAIGSLYDFFPNKEAIAQRLSEQFCEDLRALVDGILTDEQLVHVPLSQVIDDIIDSLVEYHQTHPGFEALWLQSRGDPRLARIYQDLTETLIRKTAWIFARRYAKSDETSILRASQVCITTTHALLTFAGDGPGLDSQIIAELKTMIRAYVEAVFGSEIEKKYDKKH